MISILVPTTGRAETIEQSVRSACKVSPALVSEILIADNSQQLIFSERLVKLLQNINDERVRVITYSERLSMAASWNRLLDEVKSDWSLYLHDDDFLSPSLDEEIIKKKLTGNSSAAFVSFGHFFVDATGKKIRNHTPKCPDTSAALYMVRECPRFVSTFYRTAALREVGGWKDEHGYFLDLAEMLKLNHIYGGVFIDERIGCYRVHADNLSSQKHREQGYAPFVADFLNYAFPYIGDGRAKGELLDLCRAIAYPNPTRNIVFRAFRRLYRSLDVKF